MKQFLLLAFGIVMLFGGLAFATHPLSCVAVVGCTVLLLSGSVCASCALASILAPDDEEDY